MGEAVNRGASGKLDGRTRFGWLKHSNRSRNSGVKRATGKAGVAKARVARGSARMVAVAKAADAAMTGAGIVGIAAATGDASKVRPKSIWRN
jgi:hypothetical protein